MEVVRSIDIDAPAAKAWAALTDVEKWPSWTESMRKVEKLDAAPFGLGSRVRITQPRLPVTEWTVTEFEAGTNFAWASKRAGMTTVGGHRITPKGDGCTVTLTILQTGLLAGLVALFYGGMTRRYVGMEAEGLKRFCEGA